MTPSDFAPLIQLSRGGLTECVHFGALAVVNARDELQAFVGKPHMMSFTRSTLKALQALPFMQAGGAQEFGLTQPEVAMLCASHNGEDMHVQAAESMLAKAGQDYKVLRCGCHVPGTYMLMDKTAPDGIYFDERHNNCSGKHAGFVAHCVQNGWSLDDYIAPDHPLQKAIARDVATAVGMDVQDLKMGIDGCSAPNYAMPLSKLAYGYARLASGAQDAQFGSSFAQLGEAMTAYPEMVSGTGRNDLAFMQIGRGDWITKIGADGVQVVASKSRGEALAVKISDGNKTALYAATVEALEQLGWLDTAQREALQPWRAQPIINPRGISVGARDACFRLQIPA
jgi:L-asparaginase II